MFGEKFRYAMARLIAGPFGAVTVVVPEDQKVQGHTVIDGIYRNLKQRGGKIKIGTGASAVITNKNTGERFQIDDWNRPDTDSSASVRVGDEIETIIHPGQNIYVSPRGMKFTYHED